MSKTKPYTILYACGEWIIHHSHMYTMYMNAYIGICSITSNSVDAY